MTALFFIMLVLFVVAAQFFQNQLKEANVLKEQKAEIENIQEALQSLDNRYFEFDDESKRYRMNIDVQFSASKSNINVVSNEVLYELEMAGQSLYEKIDSLIHVNENVYYLLIIEGNTQKYKRNYLDNPNEGYILSYERALALYNFWKERGINFRDFDERCELIIAGSGYFSLSRYPEGSPKNRRFTLQITSKWSLNESDSTSK
jgi:outer membrane protein OmpA-like peptidoglycan-associated protein